VRGARNYLPIGTRERGHKLAAASLATMYPGRFWLGIGTGEWPDAPVRLKRMVESIEIIKQLFI
jgi:hypothetical protein